jgi:protein CpxP
MKKLGKIKTLTIASLSAVALAAPIAFAQSTSTTEDTQQVKGEGHGGHGKGWGERGDREGREGREGRGWGRERGGRMFGALNLTDDQKAKMKEIGQSFRGRTQSLREQLHAKRQELRQANEGGTFNEALATQKLQESADLQAKLMGEQFRMHQEMLSVLTPEQKTQLEQKRAEFKAKRANHGEQKVQ